jgi:predicted nucleotidyltransferase
MPSAEAAAQLRAIGEGFGIRNIRVFGSVARRDATAGSDLDLLVDYVPGQSEFAFLRFCKEAEELIGRRVDVATAESLHLLIRDDVLREAIPL